MNEVLQNIVDRLKSGYFFLEDHYYGLLDKVNERLPVYKVIDPIDKVFPSLLLFIIAAFLLAVFLLAVPSLPTTATLLVVGEDKAPVAGAAVSVYFLNQSIELETDASGQALVSIPGRQVDATVSLSKKDFQSLTKNVTLRANELAEFTLLLETAVLQPSRFTVYIVDSETNRLIKQPVSITLACSTGVAAPAIPSNSTGEFKDIVAPADCGTLVAQVTAEGFKPKSSVSITNDPTYIKLEKIQTTTSINVLVKDHEGRGVENAVVKLFDWDQSLVDQITSSASGAVSFSEVPPGSYSVTASHPDGRYAEKSGIQAAAGVPETVTLTLPELLAGKKVFFHLTDESDNSDVANATILLYANGLLLDSLASSSSGLAEKLVGDSNAVFAAVIWHEDYVTKIVSNVVVMEAAGNSPQGIKLTPFSEQESGSISVKVTEYESGESVEGAYVYLYAEDLPDVILNHPYDLTNADGNAFFERLPAGSYFAKAKKADAEGKSEAEALALGSTVSLNVVLVLTEGDVLVEAVNRRTGEKIQGADVYFIDASPPNQVLQTGTTDAKGEFKSNKFKSNKSVAVKVSKENYLDTVTAAVPVIARSTQKVTARLVSKDDIDLTRNISIEFAGVYSNASLTAKATKVESGQRYYVKFELLLPQDENYGNLTYHADVGPEGIASSPQTIPHQGYVARLLSEVSATPVSSAVFSSCLDAGNPFSNPCVTDGASKQVNIKWESVQGLSKNEVVLKIETEENLDDGTEIELRYQAKAVLDGTEFESGEFLKTFKIGETACTPGDDCPVAVWRFWIEEENGSNRKVLNNFSQDAKALLATGLMYNLIVEAHNTSGSELVASLEAVNENPSNVLSIVGENSYTFFSGLSINANEIYRSSPTAVMALQESSITAIRLSMTSTRGLSDEVSLFFGVEADANLVMAVSPSSLLPNDGAQKLSGKVTTPKGTPVGNASVKVYLPGQPPGAFQTLTTDSNGSFETAENFRLPPGALVRVIASAPRYRNAVVVVPVKWGDYFDPRYNCVDVPSGGAEILTFSDVRPGQTRQFNVVNNCSTDVEIRFNSKLAVTPATLNIPAGGQASATVKADNPAGGEEVYLGQYPVYVKARLLNDVRFVNAVKVLVIISDPAGSCYSIDKTSFNLLGTGKGTGEITNDCWVQFNDAWAPELAIDSFKVIVDRADVEIPDFTQFNWGVNASVTLSKATRMVVEDIQPGAWKSFYIPTGLESGTTFDGTVTVNIGADKMRNVSKFRFDAVVPVDSCPDGDNSATLYLKGPITVSSGGRQVPVQVPCTSSGCTWSGTSGCVTDLASCHEHNPCWYSSFEVGFDQPFASIDSISLPVYNLNNNGVPYFMLEGDIVTTSYDFNITREETAFSLGSFTSAIPSIRNLGFALGKVNKNLAEKFDTQLMFIEDIELVPYSGNPAIETWVVGDTVYAKYVGNDTDLDPEKTPFELTNLLLNTTQYNLIYVDDYVREAR